MNRDAKTRPVTSSDSDQRLVTSSDSALWMGCIEKPVTSSDSDQRLVTSSDSDQREELYREVYRPKMLNHK